jgi:hypothetical protein
MYFSAEQLQIEIETPQENDSNFPQVPYSYHLGLGSAACGRIPKITECKKTWAKPLKGQSPFPSYVAGGFLKWSQSQAPAILMLSYAQQVVFTAMVAQVPVTISTFSWQKTQKGQRRACPCHVSIFLEVAQDSSAYIQLARRQAHEHI